MRLWSTEFVSSQAQWVGMPFTFYPYLMQIASVNSCLFSAYLIALIGKADSQEDAPFSIAPFIQLLWLRGHFLQNFITDVNVFAFFIFLLSYSVFYVSGELLVRVVVVKIELLSVDFGLVYLWSEWSACIQFWQFPEDLSDLAHHAWEEERVFVLRHN